MNISATNCTPIKPQASFKGYDGYDNYGERYEETVRTTDKLNNDFVQTSNIKKPLAVVATVAIASILAFGAGKTIAHKSKNFINNFLSTEKKAIDITNPDCVKYFERPLKEFSKSWQEKAVKLQSGEGKFGKTKKVIGMVLEKTEDTSRKLYKKIINLGIDKNLTEKEIGAKKFENLGGAIGVGAFIPSFSAQDNDGNGVSDVVEKNQSVLDAGNSPTKYDRTKGKIANFFQNFSVFEELFKLLT